MRNLKIYVEKIIRAAFVFITLCLNLLLSPAQSSSQPLPSNLDLSLPLSQCWRSEATPANSYFFASDNQEESEVPFINFKSESFLLPSFNQSLEHLNVKNGRRLWISELDGKIVSKLSVADREIFLVVKTGENYFLRNINKVTGIVNWQTKLGWSNFAGVDDEVFLQLFADRIIIINRNGDCYVLKKEDGKILRQWQIASKLTSIPAFAADTITIGNADNKLVTVSAVDGTKIKEFKTANPITAIAFQTSDQLVFGDKKGNVSALSIKPGNEIWKIRLGAEISSINPTGTELLISSFDNFIYLISPNSGKIFWKKRLPGRILYKPLILDKYALITNSYDSNVAFIDLKSGKTVNRIVFEEGNYFTNNILLEGGFLIFSNLRGLSAYSLVPGVCGDG